MAGNIQYKNSKITAKQQILHKKSEHFGQQTDQNLAKMEKSHITNKRLLRQNAS